MMNQIKFLVTGGVWLMRWPLLCGLVCLALARLAPAADPMYQIDYPVIYMDNRRMFTRPISSTTPVPFTEVYGYCFEVDFQARLIDLF